MKKIMLMGPYPPPECGTSIPFKLLADYIEENAGERPTIIDTQSGDKAGVPLYSIAAIKPFIYLMIEYVRKIRGNEIVLINGTYRFTASVGALLTLVNSKILRKKTVIYIAGGHFDQYYLSQKKVIRSFIRYCLNSALVVGVQTKLAYEGLKNDFQNAVQIPNWIDTKGIPAKESFDKGPNGSKQIFRLVFAGNVIPEKGVLELIEAFVAARAALADAGVELTIDIFGATKPGSEKIIMNAIDSCPTGLKYHGHIEHSELMSLLKDHDALVLPTKYQTEGYPAVLLEAMASGLPVITTNHRAMPEIVENEYNGFMYDQNDIEALREAIIRMAIDTVLWQTMSDHAKQSAKKYEAPLVLRELCQTFQIFP